LWGIWGNKTVAEGMLGRFVRYEGGGNQGTIDGSLPELERTDGKITKDERAPVLNRTTGSE
jgi:hypothetical protein